jgi:hypothetical protein
MNKKFFLNGTWGNGIFKLVIKENTYVSLQNGSRYGKGTFVYDNENFTLTSTHARRLFFWNPLVEEVKGNYILAGDEVNVSNIEGRYETSNGKWVQIKGKWNLTRCSK